MSTENFIANVCLGPKYPQDIMVWLIFWKCCRENLSFHNLMLGKWGWKHVAQQLNFPSPKNIYPTVTENECIIWNLLFLRPNRHLFKFSNNNSIIMCKICSKLTIEASDIVLVSLILTLNIFDLLFSCFVVVIVDLLTCKCQME